MEDQENNSKIQTTDNAPNIEGIFAPEKLYSTPFSQMASNIYEEISELEKSQQQSIKR